MEAVGRKSRRKGMVRRHYEIQGISCHSSTPDEGISAQRGYVHASALLYALENELKKEFLEPGEASHAEIQRH